MKLMSEMKKTAARAYAEGVREGRASAKRGEELTWFQTIRAALVYARDSDTVREELFKATDPYERRRRIRRNREQIDWLAAKGAEVAELLLRIVEWVGVVGLFRYLAKVTAAPTLEAISWITYIALWLYMGRYLIPLLTYQSDDGRRWLAALKNLGVFAVSVGLFALLIGGIDAAVAAITAAQASL